MGQAPFLIVKLQEAGVSIREGRSELRVSAKKKPRPLTLTTLPHPGFPTDLQPQMMALLTTTDGVSIIRESVWENRFMHVAELVRMGADITVQGKPRRWWWVGRNCAAAKCRPRTCAAPRSLGADIERAG